MIIREIPIEIWLIIFKFTDNNTFHSLVKFITDCDGNFGDALMQLVCKDVVKYNNKIVMMNMLINNYEYFVKRENYLQFRLRFIADPHCNKIHMIKFIENDTKNAILYREYIIKNWKKIFKDDRKKFDMFVHQTRSNRDEYDRIEIGNVDYMNFYENRISINDIIKYTIPYNLNYCFSNYRLF